ncbi:MAG TPA: hypothetical protein PLP61_01735 [Nocardioides sp.]|uniref:hypothetical protein n=1 Tax=Nocardioides sp. TaxID=35761 RepID=UPI002C50CC22|nr:hypothetical protein [Nocardioides sp.]HQR25734.1 hypothetical protein [Nocardioides sp.]
MSDFPPGAGSSQLQEPGPRVFFAHQSVGWNLLSAIPALYAASGSPAPQIVELPAPSSGQRAVVPSGSQAQFTHTFIGQNGDPVGKIEEFDSMLRSGVADDVDVAFMKFCYLDVTAGTDVQSLFARYRDTLSALERDYPDVTFLHMTTPLTTQPGLKTRIKSLLGADNPAADNVAREQLNQMFRDEYGSGRLFDLAAFESTTPQGDRVTGTYDGQDYFALYSGYATDEGHLNAAASQVAAADLLDLVQQSAGKAQ